MNRTITILTALCFIAGARIAQGADNTGSISIEATRHGVVVENVTEEWLNRFCSKHKLAAAKEWPVYRTTGYPAIRFPPHTLDHMKIASNKTHYFFVDLKKRILLIKPREKGPEDER